MNDLPLIAKQNADAVKRAIRLDQVAGKHVVAEYTGLHITSFKAFNDVDKAQAHAGVINAETGRRAAILPPL